MRPLRRRSGHRNEPPFLRGQIVGAGQASGLVPRRGHHRCGTAPESHRLRWALRHPGPIPGQGVPYRSGGAGRPARRRRRMTSPRRLGLVCLGCAPAASAGSSRSTTPAIRDGARVAQQITGWSFPRAGSGRRRRSRSRTSTRWSGGSRPRSWPRSTRSPSHAVEPGRPALGRPARRGLHHRAAARHHVLVLGAGQLRRVRARRCSPGPPSTRSSSTRRTRSASASSRSPGTR